MPHYLRLLNAPSLEEDYSNGNRRSKKKATNEASQGKPRGNSHDISIQFKLSCMTDLGDAFYDHDLVIVLRLLAVTSSGQTIAQGTAFWKKGMRVLSDIAVLRCTQRLDPTEEHWLSFEASYVDEQGGFYQSSTTSAAQECAKAYALDTISIHAMPEILSVSLRVRISSRSTIVSGKDSIQRHVLRRLGLRLDQDPLELRIYEEIGESIAKHIWDASLALLAYCTEHTTVSKPSGDMSSRRNGLSHMLSSIFNPCERSSNRQLEILELGSGCGIVALGLARLVPNAHFILTDLPEVMDILDKNISTTMNLGLSAGTTVCSQILDWNSALISLPDAQGDSCVQNQNVSSLRPDLILVSDCTYNHSSFQALIATLLQVVKHAHHLDSERDLKKLNVLVSYKNRHESESQFFVGMQSAGFEVLAREEVLFPDRTKTKIGLDLEMAELYAFGWTPNANRGVSFLENTR